MLTGIARTARPWSGDPGWSSSWSVGFPVLGAILGLVAQPVASWALGLPWVPFEGPLRLVETIPQPQGIVALVAAGVVLGVVVALTAEGEVLRVGVSDAAVTLTRDGRTQTIERPAARAVFVDGKSLVLTGRAGEELAREKSDLPAQRLAAAFTAHGFPWHEGGDPYRDEYRRWVEDTPDLPAGADAVFRARQRALDKGDQDDAVELREELAKLGIVVRDEERRQYWRRVRMGA